MAALQDYERCDALQENVRLQLPVIAQRLGRRLQSVSTSQLLVGLVAFSAMP